MSKIKICHISTLHRRDDVRIFHKECMSLVKNYQVHYIVADGEGDEIKDQVIIHDIGLRQTSRFKRAMKDSKKAFAKAVELDCELYHFHDPELLKIAVKLKKKNGKTVVYDAHEDLPVQIFGKPYIPYLLKPLVSALVAAQLRRCTKKLDYIVAATPFIREKFLQFTPQVIDINNYPIIEQQGSSSEQNKENAICYVGGISENRGVFELIESLKQIDVTLYLAGEFETEVFKEKCMQSEGWDKVKYVGFVSRDEILEILQKSRVGLVTLHPLVSYLDSLPIKMFEYMQSGIPVIASHFPYWQTILDENRCGITTDPLKPEKIAAAITTILSQPEKAEEMGASGRNAVLEKYNWKIEEKKLLKIYKGLEGSVI